MIGDADHWIAHVLIHAGPGAGKAEAGDLYQQPAILRANVEAWADLVSHAGPVERADVGVLGDIEHRGHRIMDRSEYVTSDSNLRKRIEIAERHVVDVGAGDFLLPGVDKQ